MFIESYGGIFDVSPKNDRASPNMKTVVLLYLVYSKHTSTLTLAARRCEATRTSSQVTHPKANESAEYILEAANHMHAHSVCTIMHYYALLCNCAANLKPI